MTSKHLDELKGQALALMDSAGFSIKGDIDVVLDAKLPFMGYTTERDGKPVIVVSGMSFSSGSTINLLVHEMSHIYRSQSGHPSHDYQLLTGIAAWVMHGKAVEQYQEEILQSILNHLQDLYADDISFAIFAKIPQKSNLSDFFISWIHEPVTGVHSPERAWTNASRLLSTAFAQANLERHQVKDEDGKVAKAVEEFLSKLDKNSAGKYDFFKNFMVNLPEKVTEKEFEKLLIQYLSEFLKLTSLL